MFVTFEGPEGSGKTTVIAWLRQKLESQGHTVCVTREPGAALGGRIREILLHGGTMDPKAEVFLFLADRAEHATSTLRPALERGEVVLCDRHADSTVVYQGVARGLGADRLREWNTFATGGLKPDLTILLDLPVEVGLARLKDPDRLDREPLDFHRAVREGFLAEARREPERWIVVDASQPVDDVWQSVWAVVASRLSART